MEKELTNPEDNITSAVAVAALEALPSPASSPSSVELGNIAAQTNQGLARAIWLWKDTRNSFEDLSRQEENNHQEEQQFHHFLPLTSQVSSSSTSSISTTTTTTISSPPSFINRINDFILQYVDLNLVRKMIAQNLIEILFICVIITYLVFYFSQISRVSIII